MESLIALLIGLVVLCMAFMVVFYIVKQMELVQPLRSAVLGLVGLIMILMLLAYLNHNHYLFGF